MQAAAPPPPRGALHKTRGRGGGVAGAWLVGNIDGVGVVGWVWLVGRVEG